MRRIACVPVLRKSSKRIEMGAIRKENVTGLIFAGGRATRMGGANKALLQMNGRPLIAWVADCLGPQTSRIVISANRDPESFRAFSPYVVHDRTENFPGPLAALDAAYASGFIQTEWVLTAPCDAPWLPMNLVERFSEAEELALRDGRNPKAFVAQTFGHCQSAVACVRTECLGLAKASIEADERRLRFWYQTLGAEAVSFPDESAFANLNTHEELEAASRDGKVFFAHS